MNYSKGFRSRFLFCIALMSLTSGVSAQFSHRDSTLANNNTIHIKVNEKNGVPHRIIGLNVDFNRYGTISMNSISSMSRAFLSEYASLFHIKTESLVLVKAENRKGRWYIEFEQRIDGIPVHGSNVGFTILANGHVPS